MNSWEKKTQRGAILIIVLWVLTMLTAIGLGMSYRAGLETKRIGALSGKVQSLALCQAAVARMIYELETNDVGYDSLRDTWSNNAGLFDHYRLQTGTYTVRYQRTGALDTSKQSTFFGATDEESFLNVNTVSKETWERLLKDLEISPDLHEAIMDWIDTDSNARFHGAEGYDYASLERPYLPRNGKIPMLEELLLVKGMNAQTLKKIEPFVTVRGEGKVNINTASGKVLEALGLPADLVEKILRYRRGLDDTEGTQDDGIFRDATHVPESLQAMESVSNSDRFLLNNLSAVLTVSSRFFRMHVQGESSSGIITRVTAVVERFPRSQGIPTRIVSWKEE